MEDIPGSTQESRQRQASVEVLVGALVKSAKTVSLYKPGHPVIAQVAGRVNLLLKAAIGQEPNLALEIKAKSVLFNEAALAETEESVALASALHMLGIGQVLFTPRVTDEGLVEFMRVVTAKPGDGESLTDLQKKVQETRIDGMQVIFILSFVVTGEAESAERKPGQLTEEQVVAFAAARNLPDFLHLLLAQNEPLGSKEGEAVTELLDGALNRELSAEGFEAGMPWQSYDPRIRACWDRLAAEVRGRAKWTREALVSSLALAGKADLELLSTHKAHEAREALQLSLSRVHAILENPAGEKQPKYAMYAMVRMLEDLAKAGNVDALFAEYAFVKRIEASGVLGPGAAELHELLHEKLPTIALAEKVAQRAANLAPESDAFKQATEFLLWAGEGMVPLLIEQLRQLADRNARRSFCSLLAAVCRQAGADHLVAALGDEDYFLVVLVLGVLVELAYPDTVKRATPLLLHRHEKVREAAIRTLGRCGGPASVAALASFINSGRPAEETKLAVTTLSLIQEPGVAELLASAFESAADYDVKVGIAMALGRLPSPRSRAVLEAEARFNWLEWLTGRNKELRQAARRSLAELAKEGKQ